LQRRSDLYGWDRLGSPSAFLRVRRRRHLVEKCLRSRHGVEKHAGEIFLDTPRRGHAPGPRLSPWEKGRGRLIAGGDRVHMWSHKSTHSCHQEVKVRLNEVKTSWEAGFRFWIPWPPPWNGQGYRVRTCDNPKSIDSPSSTMKTTLANLRSWMKISDVSLEVVLSFAAGGTKRMWTFVGRGPVDISMAVRLMPFESTFVSKNLITSTHWTRVFSVVNSRVVLPIPVH